MIPGTWEHVLQGALAVFIVLGIAYECWPRKKNRIVTRRPKSNVIDYSSKRAERLRQLGDDYLLARPINRRKPI